MYTTVEWLKQVLTLCIHFSEMEEEERKAQFSELDKIYYAFSPDERESIHSMLKSELDNQDCIYVHSILMKYLQAQEFKETILDCMLQADYNWYWGSMMEIQVIVYIDTYYEKKRLLHKRNVDRYALALGGIDYEFIPLEKRNKKKIIIVTEQILSILHAPTKMVLDFAYMLQERLDYENAIFHGYQLNMSAANIKEYHMMLELIHAWNPLFVFNIGIYNPVADLAAKFTTVAAMEVSLCCPVSEGQILLRLGRGGDEEAEAEYERVAAKSGQSQLFLEERMPVLIEKGDKIYTRQELNLPEDKFLIAIVGNRLDKEIDLELIQTMKNIMDGNEEAAFVIIGNVEKVQKHFSEEPYQSRIFYLGYCKFLMGVYSVIDLYMNPRRGAADSALRWHW